MLREDLEERKSEKERRERERGVSQRLAATSPISHRRLKTAGVHCSTYLPLAALWMQTDERVSERLPASRRIRERKRILSRSTEVTYLHTVVVQPHPLSDRKPPNCTLARTGARRCAVFLPFANRTGLVDDLYVFIQ